MLGKQWFVAFITVVPTFHKKSSHVKSNITELWCFALTVTSSEKKVKTMCHVGQHSSWEDTRLVKFTITRLEEMHADLGHAAASHRHDHAHKDAWRHAQEPHVQQESTVLTHRLVKLDSMRQPPSDKEQVLTAKYSLVNQRYIVLSRVKRLMNGMSCE